MTIETLATKGFNRTYTTLAGIDTARLRSMRNVALRECFKRMEDTPYRMQFVATVRGREYYNDAASRNVSSTWYTMENMDGGLVWITCGTAEEVDYSRLLPIALRKVRMILVLGDATNIKRHFAPVVSQIAECPSMSDALKKAYFYDSNDVKVLFSPATSSVATSESLGELFRFEVNEL